MDLGVIHLKDSLISHWASPLNHLFGVQMGYSHFSEVLKSKTILTVGMGRCSEDFQGTHAKYSNFPSQSNYPKKYFLGSTEERKMARLQLSENSRLWSHVNFFRPVNLTIPSFPLQVKCEAFSFLFLYLYSSFAGGQRWGHCYSGCADRSSLLFVAGSCWSN